MRRVDSAVLFSAFPPLHALFTKGSPMFWMVVLGIVVVVLLVLVYASTRPDEFRVERRARISAPPEKVYPLLVDFHQWPSWSPWEKLDPNLTRRHSGAPSGVGAIYEWEGNKKVGKGRMEIRKAVPPSLIVIMLDFIEPWASHNTSEFTLASSSNATDVTWTMHGPSLFTAKLMSLFVSMDKLVGKDFERGLANLKEAAERS
jgi:uncharacterized protein YndB with AHSA1/START domain